MEKRKVEVFPFIVLFLTSLASLVSLVYTFLLFYERARLTVSNGLFALASAVALTFLVEGFKLVANVDMLFKISVKEYKRALLSGLTVIILVGLSLIATTAMEFSMNTGKNRVAGSTLKEDLKYQRFTAEYDSLTVEIGKTNRRIEGLRDDWRKVRGEERVALESLKSDREVVTARMDQRERELILLQNTNSFQGIFEAISDVANISTTNAMRFFSLFLAFLLEFFIFYGMLVFNDYRPVQVTGFQVGGYPVMWSQVGQGAAGQGLGQPAQIPASPPASQPAPTPQGQGTGQGATTGNLQNQSPSPVKNPKPNPKPNPAPPPAQNLGRGKPSPYGQPAQNSGQRVAPEMLFLGLPVVTRAMFSSWDGKPDSRLLGRDSTIKMTNLSDPMVRVCRDWLKDRGLLKTVKNPAGLVVADGGITLDVILERIEQERAIHCP